MDAQERKLRVGHWVDQVAHQVLALGLDLVVFAAEWHNAHFAFLACKHAQPVAVQAGAVNHKIRRVIPGGAPDPPLTIPQLKRRHSCP